MKPPVLAIVQARMGSTRFPGKMLADLGGKPLIWWAWHAAVEAFGSEHVVCAIPANAENDELADVLKGFPAEVFRWDGPESHVLGRFYACAHRFRWHPDTVIVRVTPDDPRKDPVMLRRVARGERLPVELGGEAFTLAMLHEAKLWSHGAEDSKSAYLPEREHLGCNRTLFRTPPPPPPPGHWTVDTPADLDAIRAQMRVMGYAP